MPRMVDRKMVQELASQGAQIVEVLPEAEFTERHLPDAIHIPLARIETEASVHLDATKPVVVYCWDSA